MFILQQNNEGRYTLGDKLQQLVAATDTPCVQAGRLVAATRWGDKSLRVYWRIIVKIFVSAQIFVAATSRKKIKSDWICATDLLDNLISEIYTYFGPGNDALPFCAYFPPC